MSPRMLALTSSLRGVRFAAPVILVVTAICAVGWPSAAHAQEPPAVFRAGADAVSVEASVRRDRRVVTGLKIEDFELLDNGVAQEISDISYEKLPIDITVVLDVSASVGGPVLDELRRALKQLRADLGAQDHLRLMTFNMRVQRLVDFADPPAKVDSALASVAGSGSSAVFDSLAVALSSAVPRGRRQLIVLFSDGQDSSSITDSDTLLDVARHTTPTVAVVLASPMRQRPASLVKISSKPIPTIGDLAQQVANDTGGFVVAAAPGDTVSTFRQVLEQFRTSYVLYFTPKGVNAQGPHTLDVRVKRPNVEVRSRRSYVGQ
jgi:VWFA-related protein